MPNRSSHTSVRVRALAAPVLAALLLAGLAAGCTPNLYAITPAPPTRIAELSSKKPLFAKRKYFATLSPGVAMGFGCSDGGPCKQATAVSDDPGIVEVVPAHLAKLESEWSPDYVGSDRTNASTFVLVGVQPGQTWVRLRSKSGNARIRVTVVEDPPAGAGSRTGALARP